jgi:uncharacterized membrane protein YeaQ/YmgE (transglycosylase-associated protein family)
VHWASPAKALPWRPAPIGDESVRRSTSRWIIARWALFVRPRERQRSIVSASMEINLGKIIVWIIVGALSGSLAGAVVTRSKQGFGWKKNLFVGLAGALIGGLLFSLFKIDFGLGELKVTFEDLISAFSGALLFIFALHWFNKRKRKATS